MTVRIHPMVAQLRAERRRRGLTQEQLADMAHVSPRAISFWETGRRCPRVDLLTHAAAAMDLRLTLTYRTGGSDAR